MSDLNELTYLDMEAVGKDAPAQWQGAPPNWGKDVVSHIDTIAGQAGLAGYAYLNADEAVRDDPRNSERMRADCGIMECLEARYRASALLKWHLEPSNPKSLEQKDLVAKLSRIIESTPDFVGMRIWLNEAIYFGRSGIALKYGSEEVDGARRTIVSHWDPRHGDKFAFRMDDGTGRKDPRQVGIRIATVANQRLNRKQIERTAEGMVYWFNPMERKTVILHKHLREDGPFDDPWSAGRIHGVGIRTRIYWTWYAMVECMQRALEYLDRSAFGVELWRYPGNSVKAKAETERAAKNNVGGGRSIILVPTFTGDQADSYGVEHIEPGLAGFDRLLQVIKEVFQLKIKRYVLGQTLTSEAEATGLGSGVADAHLATFADIVSCDAQRLGETLTKDFVRHLQLWNFPRSEHVRINFRIDTESDDAEQRMKALKQAYDMGARIKLEDLASAAGYAVPTEDDQCVFNPQLLIGMDQYQQQRTTTLLGGGNPYKLAIQRAWAQAA